VTLDQKSHPRVLKVQLQSGTGNNLEDVAKHRSVVSSVRAGDFATTKLSI
jgi:hypothetical protein